MTQGAALSHAIAAFRAGRAVRIGRTDFLALETASQAMLDLFAPGAKGCLILSGPRAATLGLGNQKDAATDGPVSVARCDWMGQAEALALADPARDMERAPIGPAKACRLLDEAAHAIELARLAGLLPAVWATVATDIAVVDLDPALIDAPVVADIVARAKLPLDDLPPSQMVSFRDPSSGEDHVALVVGAFGGKPPLVRLHSECLTGDVFGSLKCDCGPQLKEALRIIGQEGGGVLLYLRQEGRGIGLANKLRAYALQDRGLDTVDANRRLGFADDERDYAMAAAMLRALHIDAVRLLTNNPNKVAGLEREGISVFERVGHHMPTNPHNADYIATKKARSGHFD
ncbi:GTP cyclohydrolase II [Sphingomonas jaspsi]|uniref:GTP cyclohydrolase II n=1 Tax=Sphingomonas jaspsi TaxID=392409 RepID=UPI0004BA6C84|nr:GTP cyclohydrolase II [Sphingomonas jaspsi]